MNRVISVDSGSSFLKIVTNNNSLQIPTFIHPASATSVATYDDEIIVNNIRYYVGETAKKATKKLFEDPAIEADFHGGDKQYIQMCYAFQQMGITGEFETLVVSLPYSDCRDENVKNKLKLRNTFKWKSSIKNEWKDKYVSFKDIKIYPQGIGALRMFTNNLKDKPKSVCLIDIGSCTTDIITVQLDRKTNDYVYNAEASKSLREISVSDFMRKWSKEIKQNPGLKDRKFSYFELTDMILFNDFNINILSNPKFNSKPLFDEAKKWFAHEIYNHAKEVLGDLWDGIEQVILTSGGSYLIDENTWECIGRTIKLNEWSNVQGQYLAFGGIENNKKLKNTKENEVHI